MYDTYEEYITEYKTWLKNRNTWIMSQFNIGDEDAAYYRISGDDDLNSNGVGKDSVDGLNNYVRYGEQEQLLTHQLQGTFHQMPLIPSQIQKWEPLDNTSDNFKLKLGNTYNVKELLIMADSKCCRL